MSARGLQKTHAFIDAHPGVQVWAAAPCAPWCTWQLINARKFDSAFIARRAHRRRRSRKLVERINGCMQRAVYLYGGAHFEWPRCCLGLWQSMVRNMVYTLNMFIVDFGGCAFGVMADSVNLAQTPRRPATISDMLAESMSL